MNIGKHIRDMRKIRDLTQLQLAEKTSLKPSAISHFETGQRKPSCDNLLKLATALECAIDELFGRPPEMWPHGPFGARLARCANKMRPRDLQTLADMATIIVDGYGVPFPSAGCTGE